MRQIAIDYGSGGPSYYWNYENLGKGIGGSETQLILFVEYMARAGYPMLVFNNTENPAIDVFELDGSRINSCWMPYKHSPGYRNGLEFDIYVSWRGWERLRKRRAATQILACHDIPVDGHCPSRYQIANGALDNIDAFWVLNQYHAELYEAAGIPSSKIWISEIGIDTEDFLQPNVERIPGRVVYCSHPHRGLKELRAYWKEIKESAPHATLQACWWEEEFFLPEDEALGILPMKRCGTKESAKELMQAEIFGYPSVFSPEISPATIIQAQIAGAFPVVVIQGGMRDTVQYGIRCNHNKFIGNMVWALNKPVSNEYRKEMSNAVKAKYSAEAMAQRFIKKWLY